MADKNTQGPLKFFKYTMGILAIIVAWLNFAPVKFGGRLTYFIVQGTSMLPRFHSNDLVIVKASAHYHVGELAAYHNLQLHTILFHQIVGRVGAHYLFKGLNNSFIDAYHPLASQVVGRLFLAIPDVGSWLAFFRQPWHAAWLMTGVALLLWGGMASVGSNPKIHRTPGMHPTHFHSPFGTERSSSTMEATKSKSPKVYRWLLATAEIFAALFLMGALWAWTSPVRHVVTRTIPYQIHSQFLYQASVPKGAVYPRGTVVPGSSVFLHLTHAVNITFQGHWQSSAAKASVISGEGELVANMTSNSGWISSWILAPQVAWVGPDFALKGTMNTRSLNTHITQVSRQTGLPYSTYTLTITPHVVIRGQVLGQPFRQLLTSPLVFSYSPEVMQLTSPNSNVSPTAQLHSSVTSRIPYSVVLPNRLGLGAFKVPVIPARWISTVGFGVLMFLSLFGGIMQRRREKSYSEADHIAARFGELLIPVMHTDVPSLKGAVQVHSIENLVKLADQYERPIFYSLAPNNTHRYILKNGRETYYYQIRLSPAKTNEESDAQDAIPVQQHEEINQGS